MTLSSAYIELFIRGEMLGGNVREKCPDTVMMYMPNIYKRHILLLFTRLKIQCWASMGPQFADVSRFAVSRFADLQSRCDDLNTMLHDE